MRQKLTNKLNKYIEYDPNAKGYRYIVDGEGKSSVTTVIGTYKNTKAFEARKRNKCLDALKTILLKENKPLDEINSLIEQAKKDGEELEKYEMTIGSDLHEFIELYLKGKKLIFSTKEPLKTMQHKFVEWWDKQKFIVKERQVIDEPRTLESLGQELGLSKERVRQIEAAAFTKMRRFLDKNAREVHNFWSTSPEGFIY